MAQFPINSLAPIRQKPTLPSAVLSNGIEDVGHRLIGAEPVHQGGPLVASLPAALAALDGDGVGRIGVRGQAAGHGQYG